MKHVAVVFSLLVSNGCAAAIKLPGTQDSTVEIVRVLANTQAQSIKALTDALVRAQVTSCPVEVK